MSLFTKRNIAMKLYNYFKCEKDRKCLFHSISDPFKRTKHILGLCNRTLNRWIIDENKQEEIECKKKGRPSKFDSFDKDLIGRTITTMIGNNEYVTLKTLRNFLKSNHNMEVHKQSLWRFVRSLGFTFKKTKTCKDIICESKTMVELRARYLRKIRKMREDNYDIYFLDESYINAHHTVQKEWQSEKKKRDIPTGKGERIIIAHIGNLDQGLVDNCQLIFKSKSKDENGDYHKDMNSNEFDSWMCNTVVPALNKQSCIVMDNASYHNVTSPENKVPKKSMKKCNIIAWLDKHGIDHSHCKTKKDLLEVVNASEHSKLNVFNIDTYLESLGHKPVRLPPYHPQLNPIELIWAEMKNRVAAANTTFKLKDVEKHTKEALSKIDKEFWQKCERHVRKIEEEYWEKDGLNISQQPSIIIDLMEGPSDSE